MISRSRMKEEILRQPRAMPTPMSMNLSLRKITGGRWGWELAPRRPLSPNGPFYLPFPSLLSPVSMTPNHSAPRSMILPRLDALKDEERTRAQTPTAL